MFKLHLPVGDVAGQQDEDNLESLFPHTPRLDSRCFAAAPPEELVLECLRPGSCSAGDADREWMKKMLCILGHAANERDHKLMAHSFFQCAFAATGSINELLSSTNMRRKLGQWSLCERLYAHVESLEITPAQREVSERWHTWVNEKLSSSAEAPPQRLTAEEEFRELIAAPSANANVLPLTDAQKLLLLLRSSGHGANRGQDFETAHTWFDCAFALSGQPNDLLSAANMRGRLVPTSAVAMRAYEHVLMGMSGEVAPTEKQATMAEEKLGKLRALREAEGLQPPSDAAANAGNISHRDYF